ncbi:MAG: GIY-YIG nuclease family protein [Alphaproteobacteria bacterium]|nr:GIY-YIG nuclease family protein [Alphaproteobacteria bacterium]
MTQGKVDRLKAFCVYIMASKRNGTLYVGVTSDLVKRAGEHRDGLIPGFTATYGVKSLVYYEEHPDAAAAIEREKRIKRWRRAWKLALIEERNPQWTDLLPGLHGSRDADG